MVNMAVARYVQSPVLLVGDIDRGGIFAQLLGTLWLLEPEERALVHGLVVNKFRGDPSLFTDGIRILEEKGGLPVLGVVPYLDKLLIPEEDAVALEALPAAKPAQHSEAAEIDIVVIHLPRISNFDDFDAFQNDPGIRLRYVGSLQDLGKPHAIILPGTKSTAADLEWLRRCGLAQAIQRFASQGGAVVGICGGYQMLGRQIIDPDRLEASQESVPALGLLPVETRFISSKATYQAHARVVPSSGWLSAIEGMDIEGYEIHMGQTISQRPWLEITARSGQPVAIPDGATSQDGRVWGCYLHGLFNHPGFRRAWLSSLGWEDKFVSSSPETQAAETESFARLAQAVEAALDLQRLEEMIWAS
jgi:adenosylcobyric acid synthase